MYQKHQFKSKNYTPKVQQTGAGVLSSSLYSWHHKEPYK